MARSARPRRRDIFPIGWQAGAPSNPPVNSVAPVASGSLTVGSVLSVTTGTWTNSPSGYAYQWKRDAVDIATATAATYTLVTADIAAMVSCRVTATNADGSASANSNALGPVTAGVFFEPNTNVIPNPQAINLWTPNGCTVAANAVADPTGAMTAETMTDTGGGATALVIVTSTASTAGLTVSTVARASVYAKAGTAPWVRLAVTNMAPNPVAWFNPATGALGTTGGAITSGADAPIDGWYRFWLTYTCDATDVLGNMTLSLCSANNVTTIVRNGTQTGHFWLAQLARV